jgi:4-hydroxy-2-oxoheptanedioate aldolase
MNVIQKATSEGRPTFGVWSHISSQVGAEVLGQSGIDWVLLDLQHGASSETEVLPLIQAIELGGSSALVRAGSADPRAIMRVLDLGAIGVVVPMISTPAEALTAARATRYPPRGNRSFGPLRHFHDPAGYDAPTCIVMIETAEAMNNLDPIVSTPGVDVVLVGPADLGLELGVGLDASGSHPDVIAATDAVIAACRRHGRIPGGVATGPQSAETLLQRGMRFLIVGSDFVYLAGGIAADVARARDWARTFAT